MCCADVGILIQYSTEIHFKIEENPQLRNDQEQIENGTIENVFCAEIIQMFLPISDDVPFAYRSTSNLYYHDHDQLS